MFPIRNKLNRACALLVCLAVIDLQSKCEAQSNVLYGLSCFGAVGQIDTQTGAWTAVRDAPFKNLSKFYWSLSIDGGTFVAGWTQTTTAPANYVHGNFIAFGAIATDACSIGHVTGAGSSFRVRPGLNTPMEMTGTVTTQSLMQLNLTTRTISAVPNSSNSIPSCSPGISAWTFKDQNTIYAVRGCWNSAQTVITPHFVRWTFANNTWTENLDIALATTGTITGGMAVDPANPNTIYYTGNNTSSSSSGFGKMTFDGSGVVLSGLPSIPQANGMCGLTFGPPLSQIVSPRSVSSIDCKTSNWSTIQKMLTP